MAEGAPIMAHENEGSIQPRILRGRVDSLSLYEITDYELQVLEEGSPSSTYLNFAIFFLSIAAAFLIALLTTPPAAERLYTVFVVMVVVGFSSGFVLLVLWRKSRTRLSVVIQRIRERCEGQARVHAGVPVAAGGMAGEEQSPV
jgi:hypothetical protein